MQLNKKSSALVAYIEQANQTAVPCKGTLIVICTSITGFQRSSIFATPTFSFLNTAINA